MSNIKNYQTILKPIVTEKSSLGSEYNQVTFQVANESSKISSLGRHSNGSSAKADP